MAKSKLGLNTILLLIIIILILSFFCWFFFFGGQDFFEEIGNVDTGETTNETCTSFDIPEEFRGEYGNVAINNAREVCEDALGTWIEEDSELACRLNPEVGLTEEQCNSAIASNAKDFCTDNLFATWYCLPDVAYAGCACEINEPMTCEESCQDEGYDYGYYPSEGQGECESFGYKDWIDPCCCWSESDEQSYLPCEDSLAPQCGGFCPDVNGVEGTCQYSQALLFGDCYCDYGQDGAPEQDCGELYQQCAVGFCEDYGELVGVCTELENGWCDCLATKDGNCEGNELEAQAVAIDFMYAWFKFASDVDPNCYAEVVTSTPVSGGWEFYCKFICSNLGTYSLDVTVKDCTVTDPAMN